MASKISDIIFSLPSTKVTPELVDFSTILRISYSWNGCGVKPAMFPAVIWFKAISILSTEPPPTIVCSFLFRIWNRSPILRDALSIGVLNVNVALGTSNVFFVGQNTTSDDNVLTVTLDGIVQSNSEFVIHHSNDTIQFKDASIPSGTKVTILSMIGVAWGNTDN